MNAMFSELISEHRQYTAYVGQTVVLPCQPRDKKDVAWRYKTDVGSEDYVYSNGKIYEKFLGRVSMEKSAGGGYDLVIHNVNSTDATQYICIEDGGFGARHIAELIVNGKFFT